jgi:hypothetical protein
MARHPDWFERLDTIHDVITHTDSLQWLTKVEIKAIFDCSERDSIRLLHRFGAATVNNALCLTRTALLVQLEAIRRGSTYATYIQKRQNVARHLTAAQDESRARQFPVRRTDMKSSEFLGLPATIRWRRTEPSGTGRFEVLYRDGGDLMSQLAQFLTAAGINREEFLAATEPEDGSAR